MAGPAKEFRTPDLGEERTTKHLANLTVHPPQPFKKIRRRLLSYSSRKSGSTNGKIVEDVQHVINPINLVTDIAPLPAETNSQITPVMVELLRIARGACNAVNIPDLAPAVEPSQLADLVFSSSDAPSLVCDGTLVPVQHTAEPRKG